MNKPCYRIQSIVVCAALILMLAVNVSLASAAESTDVILSTTTSTVDSGLLDDFDSPV